MERAGSRTAEVVSGERVGTQVLVGIPTAVVVTGGQGVIPGPVGTRMAAVVFAELGAIVVLVGILTAEEVSGGREPTRVPGWSPMVAVDSEGLIVIRPLVGSRMGVVDTEVQAQVLGLA